ncbi:Gfo/Idh/MocA family protein [Streptosporangium sp. KLBMP 9127]|nr:Gfo/Idh/MocA family oxidoreductase [Streptosporangium sp. KLBMP 9127]
MKIAIVGCGGISSRWVRVLAADPRIEIAVLVDPDAVAVARLRDRYKLHVGQAVSLDEALRTRDLDAVVNLTPVVAHVPVIRTALDAGLHVLSEKPLATRLGDAAALVDLAERADRRLMVMRNRVSDPLFHIFRDLVRDRGASPYAVTVETIVALHDAGFRSGQPLPVISDLAIHAFDQIRELIVARPTDVSCTEIPLNFLDTHCALANIMINFADGSAFSFQGGYLPQAGFRTSANGRWHVVGEGFAAFWDGKDDMACHTAGEDREAVLLPQALPGYQVCITAMVDTLCGMPRQGCLGADSLGSVALLDAALTSAASGRPVLVPVVQERDHVPV